MNFFSRKHSYQFIPDQVEVKEPGFDGDAQRSTRASGVDHGVSSEREFVRFRGDKRLIERGGDFHQSTGKIALRKKIRRRNFRALYSMDLFHSLVDAPTMRIISILMGGYMAIVILFALLYYMISTFLTCHLGLKSFVHAFFFSLETMATIGYSTDDIFFNDCTIMAILLSLQICVKLIADAVTIGVLYCKLSRPHARASTVIFSDKGVIRRIRGKLYFMFQLCELRKHQLVEAHVRVYAVRKEIDLASCFSDPDAQQDEPAPPPAPKSRSFFGRSAFGFSFQNMNNGSMSSDEGSMEGLLDPQQFSSMKYHTLPGLPIHSAQHSTHTYQATDNVGAGNNTAGGAAGNRGRYGGLNRSNRPSYMQTSAMRLNHPNDELGGMLLLMTPQVVVHEIDAGSPLMPPPVWYSNYPTGEFSCFCEDGYISGLGIEESGDCIRWRPPAYKAFIQHTPPPPPSHHSPTDYTSSRSRSSSPTIPAPAPVMDAAPSNGRVPVRKSSSGSSGSSSKKLRAAAEAAAGVQGGGSAGRRGQAPQTQPPQQHRYNTDKIIKSASQPQQQQQQQQQKRGVGLASVPESREEEEEAVITVDDIDDLFADSDVVRVDDDSDSDNSDVTGASSQPEQNWYYDAEALARIEFPSVNRRIDTDSITSAVQASHAHSEQSDYPVSASVPTRAHNGEFSAPPRGKNDKIFAENDVSNGNNTTTNANKTASSKSAVNMIQGTAVRTPLVLNTNYSAENSPLSHSSTPKHHHNEDEGRPLGQWKLQSSGLNSYYDLLNPNHVHSPHSASFYNSRQHHHHNHHLHPSPSSAKLKARSHHTSGDNSPDCTEQAVPFSRMSDAGEASMQATTPTVSDSVSLTPKSDTSTSPLPSRSEPEPRTPTKSKDKEELSSSPSPPVTQPVMTRIPILVRPSSSANMFPGNSHRSPSKEQQEATEGPQSDEKNDDKNDEEGLDKPSDANISPPKVRGTVAWNEMTALARIKSKKEMYISPYKQVFKNSNSTNLSPNPPSPNGSGSHDNSNGMSHGTEDSITGSPGHASTGLHSGNVLKLEIPPAPSTPPNCSASSATHTEKASLNQGWAPQGGYGSMHSSTQAPTPALPRPYDQQPRQSQNNNSSYSTRSVTLPPINTRPAPSYGWSSYAAASGTGVGAGIAMGGVSDPHIKVDGANKYMYDSWQDEERHMVQRYMRDRQVEIIVIVEGVDAATGGMVQARHSYTSDELEWDRSFQCCVFKDPVDGCTTIDFSLFHETLAVPTDAPFAGVVHSCI